MKLDNKASTLDGWIEAFEIFKKYEDEPGLASMKDEFYVCIEPETVSAEDRARLRALGWLDDYDDYCFVRNM